MAGFASRSFTVPRAKTYKRKYSGESSAGCCCFLILSVPRQVLRFHPFSAFKFFALKLKSLIIAGSASSVGSNLDRRVSCCRFNRWTAMQMTDTFLHKVEDNITPSNNREFLVLFSPHIYQNRILHQNYGILIQEKYKDEVIDLLE